MHEGLAGLPQLAETYPSREVLIGADADFRLAGWSYGMRVGGEMTRETLAPCELSESCTGVVDKRKASLDELHADLRAPGCISGAEDRAEALAEGDEARVAEIDTGIDPAAPRPRVFVHDSGEDQPFTAGRHAMPTALIKALGGTDDLEKGWARLA